MSKKKIQNEDFKQEDILQAVVVADNFSDSFAGYLTSKSSSLVPLVNLPVLDYVLEFLANSDVQEIIVFCKKQSSAVKKQLGKFQSRNKNIEVITVVSESCQSFGDAVREIDRKGLIRSDFILINGDTVAANIPISDIVAKHKERRKRDKVSVMTCLFTIVPPGHHCRQIHNETVLVLDTQTNKLLYYKNAPQNSKFHLPLSMFLEQREVELHYNLMDPQIAVCSPLVPPLFTDNFDWQTWPSFVKGILDNEEILGNTIHGHIISSRSYALQASSLLSYDAISKDVMHRWTYPLVPEELDHGYSYKTHNIYQHHTAKLVRGTTLSKDTVIGDGSAVGSDTSIINSVIGKNCIIGNNVRLDNVYVWDNVHIEDDCVVHRAVLADSVHVYKSTNISGSLVSEKVCVGPNVSIGDGSILVYDELAEELALDHCIKLTEEQVGARGRALLCKPASNEDDDVDVLHDRLWSVDTRDGNGGSLMSSDRDSDDISSGDENFDDAIDGDGAIVEDDQQLFMDEVIATLKRAMDEKVSSDNLVLEVNSLKHAYNIQIREVNDLVTCSLLQFVYRQNPDVEKRAYLTQTKQLIKTFLPLLKNYIRSRESQMDCLAAVERESVGEPTTLSVLCQILHYLYDVDVLVEDVILAWFNLLGDERSPNVKSQVLPFITWLEEAEETDSDE